MTTRDFPIDKVMAFKRSYYLITDVFILSDLEEYLKKHPELSDVGGMYDAPMTSEGPYKYTEMKLSDTKEHFRSEKEPRNWKVCVLEWIGMNRKTYFIDSTYVDGYGNTKFRNTDFEIIEKEQIEFHKYIKEVKQTIEHLEKRIKSLEERTNSHAYAINNHSSNFQNTRERLATRGIHTSY